ncbi:MAG TPA: hypothetical protein PKY44_05465 [Bacteroidales bacterium]|nr:hypothetical protein [Bacteroidales bacterium]
MIDKKILTSSDFNELLPNTSLENNLNPKIYVDEIIIKNKNTAIITIIPIDTDKYYINKLSNGDDILLKNDNISKYFKISNIYYKNYQLKINIKFDDLKDIMYFNNENSYIIFNCEIENGNNILKK